MSLSPRDAAEHVGLTQRSIVKAIRTGRLSAEKTSSGDWRIEPEDLYRVWPACGPRPGETDAYVALRHDEVVAILQAQISDLRSERDHWRDLAHRLAPAQQPEKPTSSSIPAVAVALAGAATRSLLKRMLKAKR